MSLIAVASAKGSPGATTLALALGLARPPGRGCLIVEADPDGGSLAARLGLSYEPGLVELAAAARREMPAAATVDRFTQGLGGGLSVVAGPASAEQAQAALTTSAPSLASGLAALGAADCIADLGRVSAKSPSIEFARRAAVALLVVRPTVHDVQYLPSRVETLRRAGCVVELVCVGTRPYDPTEVAAHLGVPLFGVWGDDRPTTELLWESGASTKRLRRSMWWRSTVDLASTVAMRMAPHYITDPVDRPGLLDEDAQVSVSAPQRF